MCTACSAMAFNHFAPARTCLHPPHRLLPFLLHPPRAQHALFAPPQLGSAPLPAPPISPCFEGVVSAPSSASFRDGIAFVRRLPRRAPRTASPVSSSNDQPLRTPLLLHHFPEFESHMDAVGSATVSMVVGSLSVVEQGATSGESTPYTTHIREKIAFVCVVLSTQRGSAFITTLCMLA